MTDKKKAKADVSLDDVREMIWQALQERDSESYLNQVYGAYVIYEKDGKFYRLPYSLLEGKVTFGDQAVEVERVWVETRNEQSETDDVFESMLRLDQKADSEGTAWDVTICEPGFTKNGWYLPEDSMREAADMFEGVDVNLYEFGDLATHVPEPLFDIKSLLAKSKVGWIDQVRYVAGEGLKGVLHFLDSAKWLGKNLVSGMQAGRPAYGLSYDCNVRAKKDTVDGRSVFRLLKFLNADSVDIVTRPAAGGKFNRAVASQAHQRRTIMDKQALWSMIEELRPDLLAGKAFDALSDEDVTALARMAMTPNPEDPSADPSAQDPPAADPDPTEDIKLWRCEMALERSLKKADLSDKWEQKIRDRFDGKVFETEDLERAIADYQDMAAEMDRGQAQEGDNGVPASGVLQVGMGTIEKAQMGVDRMFGLTQEDMNEFCRMERLDHRPFFGDMRNVQDYETFNEVPAFNSLREMYSFFTGDHEVSGRFMPKNLPSDMRNKMDITSATFSYVLGNTLGRRLVKDYKATDFGEDLLISIRKPVNDFRQQEAVLVGYFGDLDTVDPEAADYTEIAGVTDEESTYTIAQKGNLLTITRKTIINDDISMIQRLVGRLGRAARRTHAKYVWNFFINNSTCSDGTAWFTGGHGNLTASALAHATAQTAYLALAKMSEKDSGERIGLLDDPDVKPTLVYPPDLFATGEQIVSEEFYYSSNDLTDKVPNPLVGKIQGKMISLFTDADDWGLLLPASVIDMVEMGYLNGRQEPEMFLADSPQSEQVFVADKVRHKIRHEYAGAVIDYRSGYKGEV